MILWFSQHFGHPCSVEELESYINRIDIAELTHIYFCFWEEAEVNLNQIMQTDDAYDQVALILNNLNSQYNKNIELRIVTGCTPDSAPAWYDKSNSKYRYIREIYLPASLFYRTQFRLGPDNDPKQPFSPEQAEVYDNILHSTGLDLVDLYTGLHIDNFKYDYIYMTLHPKPHRCLMMDRLAKHNLHQYGALSWREYDKNVVRDQKPSNLLDSQFTNYKWQYWDPKILILDQPSENPGPINYDLLPKEYSQSFMQVIGESIFTGPNLITEKTVVPLLFNKPFLVVASRYFHRSLIDLGFELYDEIFNYDFDNEERIEDRVEGIIKNIKHIQNIGREIGYRHLIDRIKDKLIYNKKLSHQITVKPNSLPEEFRELLEHNNYVKHDRCYFIDPKSIFPYAEYAIKFNDKYMHD